MESPTRHPAVPDTPPSPAPLLDGWQTWLERFSAMASEATRNAPIACKAGCSLCCSLRVDAWAQEVFTIVRHILRFWPQDRIEELRVRLQSHSSRVLSLSVLQHATTNIPCPLLEDSRCSVYSVRPQSCRRLHATDVSACKYVFEHPGDLDAPGSIHGPSYELLSRAMADTQNALQEIGYDPTIYELGSALHEALSHPDAWSRWTNQEHAFLFASRTPTP